VSLLLITVILVVGLVIIYLAVTIWHSIAEALCHLKPAWQWLSGHTARTNATWTRRSTKDLHPRAREWHRKPGAVRTAARTGPAITAAIVTDGLLAARTATAATLAVTVVCAAAWAARKTYRKAKRWWPGR